MVYLSLTGPAPHLITYPHIVVQQIVVSDRKSLHTSGFHLQNCVVIIAP